MYEKLRVALIQSALVWESPQANRDHFDAQLMSILGQVDLIILPEMFTTGFTMNPQHIVLEEGQKTIDWMLQKAKEKDAAVMGSIVFYEKEKYYNRLFFVTPEAAFSWYDKRHTFTLAGEHKIYESGTERLIEEYKGFKICPMICYDLRFPVWARNTNDYDILVYVANWPKPRVAAWDALLKARAIENMAYCIGVNRIGTDKSGHEYSGHSAVYDTLGEQIAFSKNEEVIYTVLEKAHINETRSALKFLNDRDNFTLV